VAVAVAVAVLDDLVAAVDAVGAVIAAARARDRGGEQRHDVQGDVAGAAALAQGTSLRMSDWTRLSASTTSGCETFARSLSSSPASTDMTWSMSSSSVGVKSASSSR